jgi:hypothetical protein
MSSFYVDVPNQRGYSLAQLVILEFFIDIILPTALMKRLPVGYGLSVSLHVPIFLKHGSLHLLELEGLSRLDQRLPYIYLI